MNRFFSQSVKAAIIALAFVPIKFFAQIPSWNGTLNSINNSAVNGFYQASYDPKLQKLRINGVTQSFTMFAATNNIFQNVASLNKPVFSVLYSTNSFDFIKIEDLATQESKNHINVHGLDFFFLARNDYSKFSAEISAKIGEQYTLIFNSKTVPIAYANFTIIPELDLISVICSLFLLFFVMAKRFRPRKLYT